MKFAFVLDGLSCGGVERVAVTYCNALVEQGHEVTVLNLVPCQTELKTSLSPSVNYADVGYGQNIAPERYCSLITRFSWGRFVYPVVYCVLMLLLLVRRPYCRNRFRGYDVAISFSGHYNDLAFVGFDCVEAKQKIAWLHGTINSYALISDGFINLYKHFNVLICLSREGEQEFKSSKRWINLPTVQLYNPIDLLTSKPSQRFSTQLSEAYGDYILTVARLAYPKDIPTLIKALEVLKCRYGIHKNLLVVGDGPDLDMVSDIAANSMVRDQVHFIGYVNDPSPYYDACAVFVLSSLSEGLPTVLLEAMARGKPVVSTDTIGAREVLNSGEFGALCGIGDADSMACEIAGIYGDPLRAKHNVTSAKRRVADFEKNKVIARFLEIIDAASMRSSSNYN